MVAAAGSGSDKRERSPLASPGSEAAETPGASPGGEDTLLSWLAETEKHAQGAGDGEEEEPAAKRQRVEEASAGDGQEAPGQGLSKAAGEATSQCPQTPVSTHDGAPKAAAAGATDDAEDSDDEWGNLWTGKDSANPQEADDPKASGGGTWADSDTEHRQEKQTSGDGNYGTGWTEWRWDKKAADGDADKEAAVVEKPTTTAEGAEEDEDDWGKPKVYDGPPGEEDAEPEYENSEVEPDVNWSLWPAKSPESLVALVLVQKIRARTWRTTTPGGPFPSEQAGEILRKMLTMKEESQRLVVALLIWMEVNVLEVKDVPVELSEAVIATLENDQETLKTVCRRVPKANMNTRAAMALPSLEDRKEAANNLEFTLIKNLYREVSNEQPYWGTEEDVSELFAEVLGHVPLTIRIVALAHALEYAMLKPKQFRDQEALAVALAKLALPERAMEIACRVSLREAINLANSVMSDEMQEIRVFKIHSMNRLFAEWHINPSEEDLAHLHVVPLTKQLELLLGIERDVEEFWVKTAAKVKDENTLSRTLREYFNFDALRRKHLYDDGSLRPCKLQDEGGLPMSILEMARVRTFVSDILALLKNKYSWKPDPSTTRQMKKVNWVARLSSLLQLVRAQTQLHADMELRRLLNQERHRKLGVGVLREYVTWQNMEGTSGMEVRAPTYLSQAQAHEQNRRYTQEYVPDPTKHVGPDGYAPKTPATFFTPGTPGMWQRPPGTPAGPPPQTPGFFQSQRAAAGTPAGPPPATPGAFGFRAAAAGTPAGMPPQTPAFYRGAAAGTPAGPPPGTPGMPSFWAAAGTPAGMPSTPGGAFRAPPGTPGGPPPATPGQSTSGGGLTPPTAAPYTPGLAMPFTPGALPGSMPPATPGAPGLGNLIPRTPQGFAPATPGMAPMTPAAAFQPPTPDGPGRATVPITPGGPGISRVPATPREAFGAGGVPATPMGGIPGGIPMTPRHAVSAAPSTPAAALQRSAAPFTPAGPAGAAPFTPAVPGVPTTPAPQAVPQTPNL